MWGFQYRVLNTVIAGLAGSKRIRALRRVVGLPEVFMGKQFKPDSDVADRESPVQKRPSVC